MCVCECVYVYIECSSEKYIVLIIKHVCYIDRLTLII